MLSQSIMHCRHGASIKDMLVLAWHTVEGCSVASSLCVQILPSHPCEVVSASFLSLHYPWRCKASILVMKHLAVFANSTMANSRLKHVQHT